MIVTYNGMQWVDRCITSLEESTAGVGVIVVDNGSTDGTASHVPSRYPDVVWMPQQRNLGFGAANNIGIRYAMEHEADYVLLLNQDASVDSDTIEKLINQGDGHSLISPLQLNGDGTRLDTMFNMALRKQHNGLYDDQLVRKQLADSYEIGEVCAACWLMPAALIREIGLFNPLFFHYGEDNNYYQRMSFHGFGVRLVPQARMYHDREVRGNIYAYNNNKLRRDILLRLTDINRRLIVCLMRSFSLLIDCYFVEFPRRNYTPGLFARDMLWAIFHLRSILRSRRIDRGKGAYLNP